MIIQCTKKLADAMKTKVEPFDEDGSDSFYHWHAHLQYVCRKKVVFLMNNKTRYCIILHGMKMEHFRKFDQIFRDAIAETFLAEGIAPDAVERYISKAGQFKYTKTSDRSILGQMNEFWISISWEIENHIPSEKLNLIELNRWVGGLIVTRKVGCFKPQDALKKELLCH